MPTALTLLLIVALLVWPLLQRLIRAAQNEPGRETAQPQGPPAGGILMRESQLPPTGEHRPLPSDLDMPEHVPLQNLGKIASAVIPQEVKQTLVGAGVRHPFRLRRAIVSMTLIGACRAVRPYAR